MMRKKIWNKRIAWIVTGMLLIGALPLPMDTSASVSDGIEHLAKEQLPSGDLFKERVILTNEKVCGGDSRQSLKHAAPEETITTKEEADAYIEQARNRMDAQLVAGGTFYGYEKLTETQQCIYSKMYNACVDFAMSGEDAQEEDLTSEVRFLAGDFEVDAVSDLEIRQTWTTFRADHPEFYWLSITCRCSYIESESNGYDVNGVSIYAFPEYAFASDRERADERIKNGVQEYLDVLAKTPDIYEKVRMLHDMIITRAEYAFDEDGVTAANVAKTHNIDGLFDSENGEVVCEGYTKGFQFVANTIGISNVYVVGQAGGGSHAWNLVSFDKGKTYYPLDVTWDDYGVEYGDLEIQYLYFALDRDSFYVEHTPGTPEGDWDEDEWYVETPALAEDIDHTYFVHYQTVITEDVVRDKDMASRFLKQAAVLSPNPELILLLCPKDDINSFCSMFPDYRWRSIVPGQQEMALLYLTNANIGTQIPVIDFEFGVSGEVDSDGAIVITGEAGEEFTLNLENVITASGKTSDDYIRICVDDESMVVVSPNMLLAADGGSVTITFLRSGTVRIYCYSSSEIAGYASDVRNASPDLSEGGNPSGSTADPEKSPASSSAPGDVSKPQPTPKSDNTVTKSLQWTDTKTKAIYRVLTGVKGNQVEYVKTTNKNAVKAVIPSTVKRGGVTYRVTGIGAKAWKGCKKLKTLTIGKNITSIGSKAFYGCSGLKKITVNTTGIKAGKIGKNAFKGISSKAKVKAPKKKKSAYKKLFCKAGLSKKIKFS